MYERCFSLSLRNQQKRSSCKEELYDRRFLFQDETTGGEQIARLLDFMRTIGHLLNKVIILTPQALTQFPLFRFDPKTEEEHWFPENFN